MKEVCNWIYAYKKRRAIDEMLIYTLEIPCKFVTGDGSGGTEVNIGYKDTIKDCIIACAERKKENPKINGVTIPSKISGKVNCYCEIGMTGSNGGSSWQTCFMLLPGEKILIQN